MLNGIFGLSLAAAATAASIAMMAGFGIISIALFYSGVGASVIAAAIISDMLVDAAEDQFG